MGIERRKLVIGVGNDSRSDDGAGRAVARTLLSRIGPDTEILEQTGEGADLIAAWTGREYVIVVDAVSSGNPAGTIVRIDTANEEIPADFACRSSHAFGLAQAVRLSRTLGTTPRRLVLYGIEGGTFACGFALSPAVAEAVKHVCCLVVEELGAQPAAQVPCETVG